MARWTPKPAAPATPEASSPVDAAKVLRPPAAVLATPPPAAAPLAPASPPPAAAIAEAAPAKERRARVKTTKVISLHGQVTKLTAGTIISEGSYGPGIFERLADHKLDLEFLD